MEERDGGVNKERVTRDEAATDPVGRLVKATAGDYIKQLGAPIEQNFETNGDEPEQQSGQEESPCLFLRWGSRPTQTH